MSTVKQEPQSGGASAGGTAGSGGGDGDGALNVDRANRGVWLLKVPNFVASSWKSAAATAAKTSGGGSGGGGGSVPNALVGKLRMTIDPLQPTPQFSLHIDSASSSSSQASALALASSSMGGSKVMPLDFALCFTPNLTPMHVLSETPKGRLLVEGKVEHKFEAKPASTDAGYQKLLRDRDKAFNTPKRRLIMCDKSEGGMVGSGMVLPMPGASNVKVKRKGPLPPSLQPTAAAGGSGGGRGGDNKRVRGSRDVVETRLFTLFEQQPRWNLKQLTDVTQQPQQFLKDILNDICMYHKRGPHQGSYELKPEFRKEEQQEQQQQADGTAVDGGSAGDS